MDDQATEAVESLPTESDELSTDTPTPATEGASDPVEVQAVADEPVDEDGAEPGPIPYSRFKEVNDQFKTLKEQKEREQAILKQFGFESVEEMQQAAAEQQRLDEEERVKAYFQSQVDDGELDEETARHRQELAIARMTLERERAQVQEYQLVMARDQAYASHPSARQAPDKVDDLIRSGVDPRTAVATVAELVDRVTLAIKAQTVTSKPVSPPPPMGSDNQSAQPTRPMTPSEAWRQGASKSWRDLLLGGKDTA